MGNVMNKITHVLCVHILILPVTGLGQALHPDYLDASAGSPQLRRLQPDAPSSVSTNYKTRLMGYVQSADAGQAPSGTAVRAAPTSSSPLLATIEDGDLITVTRSGEWSKIVLRRPLGYGAPLAAGEVEPVILGQSAFTPAEEVSATPITPGNVGELDPLETEQEPEGNINLPVEPPGPLPAINLNRNFEGLLVLKTRGFGLQKDFPYQLLNPIGKRLAYVDVSGVKAVDALDYNDRKVTILGTMEPVKEGSSKRIIRAKLIRARN